MLGRPNKISKCLAIGVLLVSGLFLVSWIFNIESIINISSETSNMKFNTALLFFMSALIVILKRRRKSLLINALIFISALISGVSFISYFGFNLIDVDNFFLTDSISKIYPGRMSFLTSFLFLCFIAILMLKKKKKNELFNLLLHGIIITSSYISIMTLVLKLNISDQMFFLNNTSLQTSILFMLLSISVSIKRKSFIHLICSKYLGSKLLKYFGPTLIFAPFLVSKTFINYGYFQGIENETAITVFNASTVFINSIIILIVAIKFNDLEEKKANFELSLQISNNKLLNILKAIEHVNIIEHTDRNGNIKDVNKKFEEISQYSREESIGKTHEIIRSHYHPKSFFDEMWSTIDSGNIWFGDIKNKAKDGSFYWSQTAIVPILDKNDNIEEYISIKRDVTSEKEKLDTLNNKYINQLKKEKKELEQLAYVSSHHLIEPLRIINNMSLILKTEQADKISEQSSIYLDKITESSTRLEKVVKGLLKFYKVGKNFEPKSISINDTLISVENYLKIKHNIDYSFISKDRLPEIDGDPELIKVLLMELMENAIHNKKTKDELFVSIQAAEDDDFWKFRLIDNGNGIKERDKTRVFEIFQQIEAQTNTKIGLGLALCKKIIDQHKGEISLNQNKYGGVQVFFTIAKTAS